MTHQPPSPAEDDQPCTTTRADLQAWIDGHDARHPKQPDGRCGCGWPGVPDALIDAFQQSQGTVFPTQEQHAEAVFISELGDLLPSDTSRPLNGRMQPIAWRPLVTSLYEALDQRDSELDPRFLQLMHHLLDQEVMDVLALARVTAMHPHYLARALNITLPDPERDPGPEPGQPWAPAAAPKESVR